MRWRRIPSLRPITPGRLVAAVQTRSAGLITSGVLISVSLLWFLSVRRVHQAGMTDIGLVSILPPMTLALIGILTVSFVTLVVRERQHGALLLGHVVILVAILYATPSVIEDLPRLAPTWRHLGIADYISRTGEIDPFIDAYFNWPGFFVLLSFVTDAAGLRNAVEIARWAPVVLNLLYLAPLYLLIRHATDDARVVWLSVWVFFCGNWVGQDYLSPQGLAYFLYLAALALLVAFFVRFDLGRLTPISGFRRETSASMPVLLEWVRDRPAAVAPAAHWEEDSAAAVATPPRSEGSPLQRAGVMVVIVGICVVSAPMHQLTPFALLFSVTALTALGYSPARRLPVITAVATLAWMVFMASAYLAGHFGGLAKEVGDVQGSVAASVGLRVSGSRGHEAVVTVRLALTALIWSLAAGGAIFARQRGTGVMVTLAAVPFALLALQSYGGEILLRVYLFALPAVAFLVASLLASVVAALAIRRPTAAVAVASTVLLVLTGAFLVARYGNERMDAFPKGELDAVNYVYARMSPQADIVAGATNMPWDYKRYEDHDLVPVTSMEGWSRLDGSPTAIQRLREDVAYALRSLDPEDPAASYLVFTRSQVAATELLSDSPPHSLQRLWRAVAASPEFRLVYGDADAAVYTLAPQSGS